MKESKIDQETIENHGLSMREYDSAKKILGRDPNLLELGLFSAMYSEHCSYKSSRVHLRKFPTTGEHVLIGPGENAGVVDIGDGLAVVFKMESHNHPSYIEPYQGAATGVGGILRDIFTMGARPIACLNSLRFGSLGHERTKFLVDGVVAGIAGYGNCVGVPTIGGEVSFHKSYDGNCLVNAFALGLVKQDKIFLGKAEGSGNPIIYAGSKTGRDGIHGATMASEEFSEESEAKRPTVQVGDPFTEKLLIEACLELFKTDYVIGIQDMGAAGMTSSAFEMAGRAGTGVKIDLLKVPRREEEMTSYEIMLSESQERMLIVCRPGTEENVKAIFEKWDLSAERIGEVTDDGYVRLYEGDVEVAAVPAGPLSENAPVYERPMKKPDNFEHRHRLDIKKIPEPPDYKTAILELLASPNLCSRRWVYDQYDHMVRTNTVIRPGSDSAVIRIKGTQKGIAMSLDCNSRYCYLDPYEGGKQAVAEAVRNVACSGAKPLAVTDCLNFGSPELPEVMWQFATAIEGMSEACEKLGTPVVSGNVSFYNQTGDKSVHPTPTIGCVGLLEDIEKRVDRFFSDEAESIIVFGDNRGEIGGSEYLGHLHNMEQGKPPEVDLDAERRLVDLLVHLADKGLLHSAQDISDGGIAIALADSTFRPAGAKPVGFDVSFKSELRPDRYLFSESQARALVSCSSVDTIGVLDSAKEFGVPAYLIGKTTFRHVKITYNGRIVLAGMQSELAQAWEKAFPEVMEL